MGKCYVLNGIEGVLVTIGPLHSHTHTTLTIWMNESYLQRWGQSFERGGFTL